MKRVFAFVLVAGAVGAAVLGGFGGPATRHDVAQGFNPTTMPEIQERILSGFASMELKGQDTPGGTQATGYSPRGSQDCGLNTQSNVKVNQGCLNLSDPDLAGRGQAQNET